MSQQNHSHNINNEWTCDSCTFLNSLNAPSCSMCTAPKPKPLTDFPVKPQLTHQNQINSIKENQKNWKNGSFVEIYSRSNNKWCNGKITSIFNDHLGEWLVVEYLGGKTKQIQRYSDDIRTVCSQLQNNDNNQLQNDNNSYQLKLRNDQIRRQQQQQQQMILQQQQQQQQQLKQKLLDQQLNNLKLKHFNEQLKMKYELEKEYNKQQQEIAAKELRLIQLKNQKNQIMTVAKKIKNDKINTVREKKRIEYERNQILNNLNQTKNDNNKLYKQFCERKKEEKQQIEHNRKYLNDVGIRVIWEWNDKNNKWNTYDDKLSNIIEKLRINQSYQYTFNGNKQTYNIKKIEKGKAIQININTSVKRKCRRKIIVKHKATWQWQENNYKWKAFDNWINDKIEKLKLNASFSYFEAKNNTKYKITRFDKNTGESRNVSTDNHRRIRRISPNNNHNIIYPNYWNKSFLNAKYGSFVLIQISLTCNLGCKIIGDFKKTVNNKQIISISAIQNQYLYDKFCGGQQTVLKMYNNNNKSLNLKYLWHGTRAGNNIMDAIQKEGFRKEFNQSGRSWFGQGTYFAVDASYCVNGKYCSSDPNTGIYKILYCNVICGESCCGNKKHNLKKWPKNNNTGFIYDTLTDNITTPTQYVIHDDDRACPMFVVCFK